MADRNPDGTFVAGNEIGKLPKTTSMRTWNERFRKSTTEEEFAEVRGHLMELIRDGNVRALEIYLNYTMGKPNQSVSVEGFDGMNVVLASSMSEALEGA